MYVCGHYIVIFIVKKQTCTGTYFNTSHGRKSIRRNNLDGLNFTANPCRIPRLLRK